jgi:hypothetical protein
MDSLVPRYLTRTSRRIISVNIFRHHRAIYRCLVNDSFGK